MLNRTGYFFKSYAGDDFWDQYLPKDFLQNFAEGRFSNSIYPVFSDREAWEKVSQGDFAKRIIDAAEQVKEGEVTPLLFSQYRRFSTDGDRADYENLYFKRRENLSCLALAICLTGDIDKYIVRLMDHVIAIMEERSWCVPAHTKWGGPGNLLDHAPSDLFCCETGAVMAVLYHILGDVLDTQCENISEKLRKMILERTVYNILYNENTFFIHHWYNAEFPRNWTPWCSYNAMICAILLEKDYTKLADAVEAFWSLTARSAAIYNENGYCDEGPSYYSRSALMIYGTLQLMNKALPHSMDKIIALDKTRKMFEFFAHIQVAPGHVFSFADAQVAFVPHVHLMATAAAAVKSDFLMSVCNSYTPMLGMCGDYLLSGVGMLFDMPDKEVVAETEFPALSYYTDKVAVFRNRNFVVGGKAGCNFESHNHNDLGQFILYKDGQPVIIDAGTGVYSKKNFSEYRYKLWYTRGSGHNVPVFGDIEQVAGEYTSKVVHISENKMVIDLVDAYPEEAGIEKFMRTLDVSEDMVIVSDDIVLKKHLPVTLTLLTTAKVEILSKNSLQIGNVILECENISYDSSHKEGNFIARQGALWNDDFNLLHFKTDKLSYKFIFKGVEK